MVGKVGLTVGKLGDGTMANGVLTGGATMAGGGGVGVWGATVRQPNVGGYGAVHRRGGATHQLHPVAPQLQVAPNVLFTKVRHHGAC